MSRVGADTTLLSAVVTSGVVQLVAGLVVVIGATVLMARLDVMLLITLIATGVGLMLVAWWRLGCGHCRSRRKPRWAP